MKKGSSNEWLEFVKANLRQIYHAGQDDDKIRFCALFQKCRVLVVLKFLDWKGMDGTKRKEIKGYTESTWC